MWELPKFERKIIIKPQKSCGKLYKMYFLLAKILDKLCTYVQRTIGDL